MKEGVSAAQFKNILDKELGSGWGRSYRVLGDSDFMLVTNAEFSRVLPLYFNNGSPGPFCPGSTVFKYIRNMQSELCISDIGAMKNVASYFPDENNDLIEQYRERFSVNLEKLKDFLRKNRLPGRIVYGLQIVMKRFLQLIRTKHSFDVERIAGNVFDNFFNCVIRSIDDINYIDTKINGNSEVEKMKYDYLQKFLKALNFFREKVGDYLADMQRSDSLFLEGRSLSHPSIGSATKLLFFHNWYIHRAKEKIDVEKSVGNVDNSLKSRLRFPGRGTSRRLRRRKLWKVNAKKRRKSGWDFWQNSVLTYKNFPMGKAAACSFALHITNCNILFPAQQKPLDITLKNR